MSKRDRITVIVRVILCLKFSKVTIFNYLSNILYKIQNIKIHPKISLKSTWLVFFQQI